jgi:hypothetical protein
MAAGGPVWLRAPVDPALGSITKWAHYDDDLEKRRHRLHWAPKS